MEILIGAVVLLVSHCMVLVLGLVAGVATASEIKHKEDKSDER